MGGWHPEFGEKDSMIKLTKETRQLFRISSGNLMGGVGGERAQTTEEMIRELKVRGKGPIMYSDAAKPPVSDNLE